jgi:hypothetical protein
MATAYKVLAQTAPAATTETDSYTCPAVTQTIVSSLTVCNQATATTFRISLSVDGAVTAKKDYLYYDLAIPSNDTFIATIGLTMDAADVIRVYAGTADVSFGFFGSETT